MQFSPSSTVVTLATALNFITQGSAFIIDAYTSHDCSGGANSINVYDNTCASWFSGFSSYVPRVYGGEHQYVEFWIPGACGGPSAGHSAWVDGGDGGFQVGTCYTFGDGVVINAAGSLYTV